MAESFVLLSYHLHDVAWKERIVARLEGVVPLAIWPLRDDAARPWLAQREEALSSARAAVLLVSRDSQGSPHRTGVEQPLLRDRLRRGDAEVLIVLIERCPGAEALDGVPFSGAGGTALSEVSDAEADRLIDRLGSTLRAVLASMSDAAEPTPEEDLDELFERLYDEHFPALVRFFGGRGLDPEDSRDLAQMTMLKVYRGLGQLKSRASPRPWIRQIAVNVWRNFVRGRWGTIKRGRRETSLERLREVAGDWSEGEALWPAGSTDPERLVSAVEAQARIESTIPHLPPRQRECLLLWLAGWKYADIADRLGVSIENVKSSIHKAKARLKKLHGGAFGIPAASLSEDPGD